MTLWLLAVPALAGFTESTPAPLQIGGPKEADATFFDLEGDGDWDLITPALLGARVLRNDGQLNFTDVTLSVAPPLLLFGPVRGLLAADLTHDGQVDLVVTQPDRLEVFVGGAAGFTSRFEQRPGMYEVGTYEGTALLDVDADGWLDVLLTQGAEANLVLYNPADGTANFRLTDHTEQGLTPTTANSDYAAVADWDADGDQDIVIRNDAQTSSAYLAHGDGWELLTTPNVASNNSGKGGVQFCDLGDGRLDLLWTSAFFQDPPIQRFSWNIDRFDPVPWPSVPPEVPARSLACGDFDHDGRVDVYLPSVGPDQLVDGASGEAQDVSNVTGDTIGVSVADVDADGDLDVYQIRDMDNNALLINDTDDDAWMQVRIQRSLASCPAPLARDDLGAALKLVDGSLHHISGGEGRGRTGWPVVHLGGFDRTAIHHAQIRFGGDPQGVLVELPTDTPTVVLSDQDPDGDGLPTPQEELDAGPGTDTDGDGIPNIHDADADGDGLPDHREAGRDDPCLPPVDSDGDGDPDYLDLDSDDDGMSDADEVAWGSDPTDPEDVALVDSDHDGLSDADEAALGTDPNDPDTDGDGVYDGVDPDPLDPAADGRPIRPDVRYGIGCRSAAGPWWIGAAIVGILRRRSKPPIKATARSPRSPERCPPPPPRSRSRGAPDAGRRSG